MKNYNKIAIILASACFLFVASLTTVFGQTAKPKPELSNSSNTKAPGELQAVLEKWMNARKQDDAIILDQLTAAEFVFTDANNKNSDKKDFLLEIDKAEIDLLTVPISDLKVELNGDTAKVNFITNNSFFGKSTDAGQLSLKQEGVDANWKNYEGQMQRRADLIPNITQAAKLAGIKEDEFFGQVVGARAKLLNAIASNTAQTTEEKRLVIEANGELSKVLERLKSLEKKYPKLGSNEAYQRTIDELLGTENRLAVARLDYRAAIHNLNEYSDPSNKLTETIWKKINGRWQVSSEAISREGV